MPWTRFFRRRKPEPELDDEVEFHLNMAIRERMERGETRAAAEAAARKEFGNVGLVKETARAVWISAWIEQCLRDLRAGGRVLTKSPMFSGAAIVLVALGIGWNTTIYTILHGLLTKPAPGIRAERLVSLGLMTGGRMDEPENSYANYLDYAAQTKTLRPLLAWGFERFTVAIGDATYEFQGARVTRNYFDTLGIHMAKGRSFTAGESRGDSAGLVAVIGYRLWQEQFQGADDIIGRPIVLNGYPATIIGVAPPRFRGTILAGSLAVWVPVLNYSERRGTEAELHNRTRRSMIVIGRLARGMSLSEAQAEFDTISKRLQTAYPETEKDTRAVLKPYSASAFSPFAEGMQGRAFMAIVTMAALLTLLVVCANVANLMLARTAALQRELAVRQSIGASRLRIVRLLLAESLAISFAALLAAGCLTVWASRALVRLLPPNGAGVRLDPDFSPDGRVIAYAMLLALLSAVAFTLAPAVRAWRQELLPWLKAGENSVIQGRSRLAQVLVVAQLSFCVLLLTAAGLAYRSVSLLSGRDLRFNKDHLLLATVNTIGAARGKAQNIALLERLRKQMRSLPGVVSASYALAAPPRRSWGGQVKTAGSERAFHADGNYVGPDYLTALGVPNVTGRGITESDLVTDADGVVINQNLAGALWPGRSAVGRTLLAGSDERPMEVLGVTPNGAFSGVEQDVHDGRLRNFVFFSERAGAAAPGVWVFHVRYSGQVDAIALALRGAVHAVDARVPVSSIRTMQTQMEDYTGPAVLFSSLLALFGAGALILAAIGLYAVVAFHTEARTRDFGIRLALGASSRQILETVLREGLWLAGAGGAVGLALSLAVGSLFRSLLFGVTSTDPATYISVIGVLAAVSLIACYIPARRAARIDPTEALRQE